jgi:hypothetical protein
MGKAYWSREWGTQEELLYISTIGENKKNSKEGVETVISRMNKSQRREWKIKMLKGYLKACARRVFWGTTNAKDVIHFAKNELQKILLS